MRVFVSRGFDHMVWGKIIGQTTKKEGGPEGKPIRDFERFESAILRMTLLVKENKDFNLLLEHVARESFYCLMAHRSSVFAVDAGNGVLNAQYSFSENPQYEQLGVLEEKEVARRAVKQNRTFLLREPKDFSEFFKFGERDRKISSLISIPLPDREKPSRVLSIALLEGSRRFHSKDLEFLSIFTHHLSLALEQGRLREEVQKASDFQKNYEKYLDDILSQLLSLQEKERQRIDGHIIKLLPEEKASDEAATSCEGPAEMEPMEECDGLEGILFPLEEDGSIKANGGGEKVRVEFGEEDLGMGEGNGMGAAFVRTPNPMELGDLFALKLHLNDGREPLMVQGKVIWTNQYGQDKKNLRRGMGVKFVKLQSEEQKRIGDYTQKRRATLEKIV
jgi:hypothetical protein